MSAATLGLAASFAVLDVSCRLSHVALSRLRPAPGIGPAAALGVIVFGRGSILGKAPGASKQLAAGMS